jgi:HAD superfamily hydrolase (TIGR01509 family)
MESNMKHRILVFDLDGTLFRTFLVWLRVFANQAKRRGLVVRPEHVPILARIWSGPAETAVLALWPEADPRPIAGALKKLFRRTVIPLPLFEGMAETLELLRRRSLTICLLTNGHRHRTVRLLAMHGLRQSFDIILTGDEAPPKPEPDGLLRIARAYERVGLPRSELLLIGDSYIDVDCARAAQVPYVIVAEDDYADPAYLAGYGVPRENILASVRDLPAWLERRARS